ncbi:MAG: N-acetylmuramoyl-L-alanine amidase [Acidobacteriales bacterium 59-55]|nr:N-acetylmuramoyl-L-alanine amidase [Terriglobales bacterium]OJV43633.1 MAG: N-acetylmuramoyl-L-alanine amidase [Acidobacteriales bacterium 59-55]
MVQIAPAGTPLARTSLAKTRTSSTHRRVELTPWQKAVQGRETLEAISAGSRTRADYTRAMNGFREIYHQNPADTYAPPAINAVAELLAEQGRGLHDSKSLKDAIGQYEFLIKEYPTSSLRVAAVLAQAQIYENDLHDAPGARERYALLLKLYPKSGQAEEARAGLASLKEKTPGPGSRAQRGQSPVVAKAKSSGTSESAARSAERSSFAPMPVTKRRTVVQSSPPVEVTPVAAKPVAKNAEEKKTVAAEIAGPAHVAQVSSGKSGRLAQVTGIRHWSTPNYTRVAIDLGDDVTYEAARVPNPDRIYFDLHGTRLAQALVGKTFTVTDDGFLKRVRAAQFTNDMTRVVLDVNDVTEYSAFLLPNPYRLIIDIHGGSKEPETEVAGKAASAPETAPVAKSTPARPVPNTVEAKSNSLVEVASLSDQPGRVEATRRPTSQPISAVVKDEGSRSATAGKRSRHRRSEAAGALPARAAVPTADGQTSLVRALGLKIGRIVIDAGHGGHDSGTLGVGGIEEKDVVLDVALRLGKLLHDRLGAEIIYTRSDDTFIPLETRTAIANKAQADLFLSIHANSSRDESARGVETYYLNFTTSPDALETAARENAVSDQSIHQLSDLVKKIALKDKIAESREFASDVQESLYSGLEKGNAGLRDRGVKKAPFVVLIGANMPSILAEISFVTNPKDARQLEEPEYRERVAESLYRGVAKYEAGLSGAKVPVERASAR